MPLPVSDTEIFFEHFHHLGGFDVLAGDPVDVLCDAAGSENGLLVVQLLQAVLCYQMAYPGLLVELLPALVDVVGVLLQAGHDPLDQSAFDAMEISSLLISQIINLD